MVARPVDVAQIVAVALVAERPELLVDHQLRKPDDGVERRADLVADARQELGLLRGGIFGLGTGLGEFLLGALPLGDVADDGAEAALSGQAADGHEQRDEPALRLAADHLAAVIEDARDAVVRQAGEIVARGTLAFDREQRRERLAGQLVGVVAEQGFGRPADRADRALAGNDDDAVGGGVDDRPQLVEPRLELVDRFGVERDGRCRSHGFGSTVVPGRPCVRFGAQRQEKRGASVPRDRLEQRFNRHFVAVAGAQAQLLLAGVRILVWLVEERTQPARIRERIQRRVAGQVEQFPVGEMQIVARVDEQRHGQAVEHIDIESVLAGAV